MDDTIKSRGFRINLLDIDSYIHRLAYVEDCATIAIPHEDFENQIIAHIKIKEDVSIEQIKKDLLRLIPSYQIPEKILFVDTYPTNTSGKICKKSLKSTYLANRSSI
jgi:acyl-coenzyme A synthetase/AMP-(fatty) acid ligase